MVNSVATDLLQRIAPEDPVLLDYINRVQLQLLRVSRWKFLQSAPQRFVTQLGRSDYWVGPVGQGPFDVIDTGLNIQAIGPIKTDTFYDRSNFRLLKRTNEQILSSSYVNRDMSSRLGPPRMWRNAPDTGCVINIFPAPDNQNAYQPVPEPPALSSVPSPLQSNGLTPLASDPLNGANVNPLPAPWVADLSPPIDNPLPPLQILNHFCCATTNTQACFAQYNGVLPSLNQYAQCTLAAMNRAGSGLAFSLGLRISKQLGLALEVQYNVNFAIGAGPGLDSVQVFAFNGPANVPAAISPLVSATFNVGDVFIAEIIGNVITVFQNGNQLMQFVDNNVTQPGFPGLIVGTNTAVTDIGVSNFVTGTAQVPVVPLPARIYFVRTTYVDSLGNESSASLEGRVFIPQNNLLVVQPPQEVPTAASGIQYNRFNVYAFSAGTNEVAATGTETLVNTAPLATTAPYVEPPTGFPTNGLSFPTTNLLEPMGGYLIEFRYFQSKPQINSLDNVLLIPADYFDVLVAGVNYFTAQFLKDESAQAYWQQEYQSGITGMIRDKNLFPKGPEFMSPDPSSSALAAYYGYDTVDQSNFPFSSG